MYKLWNNIMKKEKSIACKLHEAEVFYPEVIVNTSCDWFHTLSTHTQVWILSVTSSVVIPMQVKRTLFVNGISKYAEESEIKQHFE